MPTAARHPVALAIALTLLAPAAAGAQPAWAAGEAGKALQAFDAAADLLRRAHATADALDAGRPPKGSPGDLAGLPAAFDRAAELLRRAEGPELPDPTIFTVGADQLRGCATRAAALVRAEQYRKELQGETPKVAELRAAFRDRVTAAQAAEEDRRALVKVLARLAHSAEAPGWLPFGRGDVEKPLAQAIQACQAELKRGFERADASLVELRARATAFAGVAAEYARAHDCALAGTWLGVRTLEGAVSGVSLRLSTDGSRWTGSANVGGVELPVRGVTLQGAGVVVSLGDGKASLRGILSADEQVLRATLTSIDGPAQLSLRRQ